ncbi:AzlD domain-containing protein [Kocuria sp. p3-SID1433]|uniref:branched-chain amino acid transporter permease n=1 Tax=unclassified Kocuria TaxID=2649579 RepID=UPI0021A452E0|nr:MULTISPECIES: AzlD domain-containing protein [unclassified Kocuria]MCT1601016.1 AzlD domain-containing protein [Kocuria sp. p3-SID1428]MCT2180869.1 AzlD domain-containing protein [Kocuria sp. p3-SID1433]
MPELSYILAAVGVAAGITWALRALPFAVLAPLRESRLLPYIGDRLGVGVMIILVIYTLQDLDLVAPSVSIPAAVALAVTIGLHLWRGNMVLSLLVGTVTHVALASLWQA